MTHYVQTASNFISPQERARLVYLCATITGSSEAAEDLAQETLLEAWRHLDRLNDPEKHAQWLSGIARNVCYRFQRKQGRDQAHSISLETPTITNPEETRPEVAFSDPCDVEIELERKELIALLDRALSLLPQETRAALIQHYIDESPLVEIARQFGTNASAIAMRLQRGKLALRRVLTTQMQGEFSPYGFSLPKRFTWESTRLWCELCGQYHLLGRLDPEKGSLELKCPSCCQHAGILFVEARYPALLNGVHGYRRALARLAAWESGYYRAGIRAGNAPCIKCGKPAHLRRFYPDSAPGWSSNGEARHPWRGEQRHSIAFICEACDILCLIRSNSIAHWEPVAQQFLREHPRVRTLPEREIAMAGRPAIVTSLESLTDNARLDLILDLETYEVVHISGGQA